jgi:hypothetical protein
VTVPTTTKAALQQTQINTKTIVSVQTDLAKHVAFTKEFADQTLNALEQYGQELAHPRASTCQLAQASDNLSDRSGSGKPSLD